MKEILEIIAVILIGIITTPVWMIGGVVNFWKIMFDHPSKTKSVENLLQYGEKVYSGFEGNVVVCTHKSNVIYEGRWWMLTHDWPEAVRRMKVGVFWIEDNKLWIKILINDKLMADLEKELSIKKEEQMRVSDDA